jgi:uncharacterized membrane protein
VNLSAEAEWPLSAELMTLEKKTALFVYVAVLSVSAGWTGGAVLAPLLEAKAESAVAGARQLWAMSFLLRAIYHFVCHQMAERSIWVDHHPMAVCARCFGIYLGCLIGLIIYPLTGRFARQDNPERRWLILALIPVGLDFLGGYLGLFQNTVQSRLVTGLIAGGASVFYVMPGLLSTALTLITRTVRLGTPNSAGRRDLLRQWRGEQSHG